MTALLRGTRALRAMMVALRVMVARCVVAALRARSAAIALPLAFAEALTP